MYLERQKKNFWMLNGKRVPSGTPGAEKTPCISPFFTVVIPLPGKGKKRVTLKGVTSKQAAMQILLKMEKEEADSLLGIKGVRPDAEEFRIDKLVELFLEEEKTRGNSEEYAKGMTYYLDGFFRNLPEVFLRQLDSPLVIRYLAAKVSRKGKPWSATAKNYTRRLLVRFGRWCKKNRYWKKNLFKSIPPFKGVAVKVRHALTLDEFARLVRAAETRALVTSQAKKPAYKARLLDKSKERALLYYFLFTVVSRLGATLKLTVGNLDLQSPQPSASFAATTVKKRRLLVKPMPQFLAVMLQEWIDHKKLTAEDKVFSLSSTLTRDFHKDLEFAGIHRSYADGTSIDIHSLKTSAISFLGSQGVEGKLLQDIGEHERLETTYGHYLKLGMDDYRKVSELFDKNLSPKPKPEHPHHS